jgi:zona occludens toxin
MIVFHEGLPRSGKSYEACVMHILPALKEGRRVVTNIEGIDHSKFSELSGLPIKIVEQYLRCVFVRDDMDEQRRLIIEETQKDNLIVIDEIQNLFPSGREKLEPEWMRYISEHGHDGLDVILMGQDRRDCHNMWRRRIQRVITFKKLTALGKEGSYAWACYEATSPEKFQKVTSGTRNYEEKYFGLYKSFTDGTTHKSAYIDKRATVWNNAGFKLGMPAVGIALVFALWHLVGFFSVQEEPEPEQVAQADQMPKVRRAAPTVGDNAPPSKEEPEEPTEPAYEPLDVFDELQHKNRLRLSAVVVPTSGDDARIHAYVDVLNEGYHVQDRFTAASLRDLGWKVSYRDAGLMLTKGDRSIIVRPWPIDKPGRVDNDTRASLAPPPSYARADYSAQVSQPSGPMVVQIPHQPAPRMAAGAM